jgi:hypothetical protein
VYLRRSFPVYAIAAAVAAQVWFLLLFLGVILAAALAWYAKSGFSGPAELAWVFFKFAVVGLIGSFVLHESAHALALKRISTVTHITIDRTFFRFSVVPSGTMTGRQIAWVAIAGPASCMAVGLPLWISGVDRSLAWWFMAHVVFLLPIFGDGQSLLRGLRRSGSEAKVS